MAGGLGYRASLEKASRGRFSSTRQRTASACREAPLPRRGTGRPSFDETLSRNFTCCTREWTSPYLFRKDGPLGFALPFQKGWSSIEQQPVTFGLRLTFSERMVHRTSPYLFRKDGPRFDGCTAKGVQRRRTKNGRSNPTPEDKRRPKESTAGGQKTAEEEFKT